jgi:hypothetical protein
MLGHDMYLHRYKVKMNLQASDPSGHKYDRVYIMISETHKHYKNTKSIFTRLDLVV